MSDEIYEHINFVGQHESIAQFDFLKDRVIIINGLSKGFAMTGWRLGYIAAPVDDCESMRKDTGTVYKWRKCSYTTGSHSRTNRRLQANELMVKNSRKEGKE